MPASRINVALAAATIGAVMGGWGIAFYRPSWPLLVYWLAAAIVLGSYISLSPRIIGIRRRARSLMLSFALLIAFALATTQLAARRTITPTHLTYHGVHLADTDSFVIGSGQIDADVRLQTLTSSQAPWLLQVRRGVKNWEVEALRGIEQIRVSPTRNGSREYAVAHSAILEDDGDWAAVVNPAGAVVDTIRLSAKRLVTSGGNSFALETSNGAISRRYGRRLASGVSVAFLEGERKKPDVYDRFVRVQKLSPDDVVNGVSIPWLLRKLPGSDRYLVSATPPYKLAGPRVADEMLSVADSGVVEVRNGDGLWRFVLVTDWRREPSADPGVSIMFRRNPRYMDTPLPIGVSCQPDAACGALSLRRLPPPVAHIALDQAGLSPERYGLLGTLQQTDAGYNVLLPRSTHQIERGRAPVAIPVADLANTEERTSRWVLLGAAGQGENRGRIAMIGLGLGLLLYGIYRSVVAVSARMQAKIPVAQERAMMLGVTAILCLLLTRVMLGGRVEFFDPFLDERGINTAVGMFVAIAIVAVGLLAWPRWLPPLLAGARGLLSGQRSPAATGKGMVRFAKAIVPADTSRTDRIITGIVVGLSLVILWYFTDAVGMGFLAGGMVLLAWVCLAWVAAFTGPHFETYERGAHTVLEQLTPPTAAARRVFPEWPLIVACVLVELAHIVPFVAAFAAAGLVYIGITALRRRKSLSPIPQPDYPAAGAAVALFMICIAVLRAYSENGSLGAFVLVVFIALVSVRAGRSVASRLEASGIQKATPLQWLGESILLLTPLLFLLFLAGIDMGLFLVMVIPLGVATALAVGIRTARSRLVVLLIAIVGLGMVAKRVVMPSVDGIRDANSHAAKAEAFAEMSTFFGYRPPGFGTPMDRAAARSVATRDRTVAEELLIAAGPGPARDLLVPSIEQIWGAKSYANAGWLGEGLGRAVIGGRGVAETVSYAENTFAVFVLGEHGALGGIFVLLLYLLLTGAVAFCVFYIPSDTPSYRASRALFVVAALIVACPAVYVALSNLGIVPITGQNMPFLGLNAWSDVVICAGVVGILITGALRGLEEQR